MKATPISLHTPETKKDNTIHPDKFHVRYFCPACKQSNSVRPMDYALTRKQLTPHEHKPVDGEVFVMTFPCGNDDCQRDLELEFAIEATEVALRIRLLNL